MANQRLLLVDDDLTWGELITLVLARKGYEVDWFVRARKDGDRLILMNPDGVESEFNQSSSGYACAFIDSRLKGSALDGPEVVPLVVAAGLTVVGVSGSSTLNEVLEKAGASSSLPKDLLFQRVMEGKTVVPC